MDVTRGYIQSASQSERLSMLCVAGPAFASHGFITTKSHSCSTRAPRVADLLRRARSRPIDSGKSEGKAEAMIRHFTCICDEFHLHFIYFHVAPFWTSPPSFLSISTSSSSLSERFSSLVRERGRGKRGLVRGSAGGSIVSGQVFPLTPAEEQAVKGIRRKLEGENPDSCGFKRRRDAQMHPSPFERSFSAVAPICSQIGDSMDMMPCFLKLIEPSVGTSVVPELHLVSAGNLLHIDLLFHC
ncbi:hypothetical protein ACLOJK_032159 [Asimina triloba]